MVFTAGGYKAAKPFNALHGVRGRGRRGSPNFKRNTSFRVIYTEAIRGPVVRSPFSLNGG